MSDSVRPLDGSPPGSPVPGILQARILEWVAISFSNAWKRKVKVKSFSRVWLSDPRDCSLSGSSIHGIFQARVLEWGAIARTLPASKMRILYIKKRRNRYLLATGSLWHKPQTTLNHSNLLSIWRKQPLLFLTELPSNQNFHHSIPSHKLVTSTEKMLSKLNICCIIDWINELKLLSEL